MLSIVGKVEADYHVQASDVSNVMKIQTCEVHD